MQQHRSLEQLNIPAPTVLTIGKFNGLHLGHRYLLEQIVGRAHEIGGTSAALTFEPHPTLVLQREIERVYLASPAERLAIAEATGLEHLITLTFNDQLMRRTAEEFMRDIRARINLKELWVGPEFRLGYKAHGTVAVLETIGRELGFQVMPVQKLDVDGEPVSATRIRALLQAGQVARVPALLGRAFAVIGEVVHGDHRGRTIGFPTANVAVDPQFLLPADGVYACDVTLPDGVAYPAVTNVGVRPTFGTLTRTVEAHLLNWSGDLYGQIIRVAFRERVRGEQKFSGIAELKAQIARDAETARNILA